MGHYASSSPISFVRHLDLTLTLRGGDDTQNSGNATGTSPSSRVAVPKKHDYFVLRHGQSLANVAGIIASNPDVACVKYGLSEVGIEQAKNAGKTVMSTYLRNKHKYKGLLIVSSDFLRAKETAESVLAAVQEHNDNHSDKTDQIIPVLENRVMYEPWLRERWFGDWDGSSDANYAKVWANDEGSLDSNESIENDQNVETVVSVRDRVLQGLREYEQRLDEDNDDGAQYMVICVAHGDVLQILQTAYANLEPHVHRSLPHLETATLRAVQEQL